MLKITDGLMDHQILQRNRQNECDMVVRGHCVADGALQVRVCNHEKYLPGFNWKTVAQVKAGTFWFRLTGIPVGGPYTIELRWVAVGKTSEKQIRFTDVLVGDLWMLAGQSNMAGNGSLPDGSIPDLMVRAFYLDDRWAPARDPLHNFWDAVDPIHADLNGGKPRRPVPGKGAGPGVSFGREMFNLTGVPQGLIACAHGGTPMDKWDPALKAQEGQSLYGGMVRRFCKVGGKVTGILWYQGCSDTGARFIAGYVEKMKHLVAAWRQDFADPKLPVILVQLASFHSTVLDAEADRGWNTIRETQRNLAQGIRRLAVVPAIDLDLDDPIHLSGGAQQHLGRRMAQAARHLIQGQGSPPLALQSIQAIPTRAGFLNVKVTFRHVAGSLQAPDRPTGFTLATVDRTPYDVIYRTELKKNQVILRTGLSFDCDESSLLLYYGYGCSPYCNITDGQNRSLPAFGPVPFVIHQKPFLPVKTIAVSRIFPGAGKLDSLVYPDITQKKMQWQTHTFPTTFYNLHEDLRHRTKDAVVYFLSRFDCKEKMKLIAGLGYDGPVKLWVDGRETFHDPAGINPVVPDKAKIHFTANPGRHEILVALSANFGFAWGISLRIHCEGVPRKKNGSGTFAVMPEIVQ